ncbi:MAG: Cyclic di-GMP phosphodiesterase response regulator RpfG [Candidatus Heimdallarchaeota archaeon LC_3]|nr:MAG: Cyclic di-GMP phosphodiesterase response regulator RpfG [Candidatus Heimdallarchaeota archaeon LC_3]
MHSMETKDLIDTTLKYTKNLDKKKILIVDDNEDQLLALKFLFTTYNKDKEYITFNSPEKAIKYLIRLKDEKYQEIMNEVDDIDIIISDYNMLPKNGLDFFKDLQKIDSSIPFILISSFLSDSIKNAAYELGVLDCIEKQVNIREMLNKIAFYIT